MRTSFVMLIILIMAAGCDLPQKTVLVQAVDNPHAWFDAPLNGSVLTLGEAYEVVFHIASLGGVARGELSIEGAVFATLQNPNDSISPATLRQMWTPEEPGVYTLKVRAQSISGQWSDYDQSVITVKEIIITPTITTTPTMTATPTLVASFTPTLIASLTPTATTTPTLPPVGNTYTPGLSTNQFFYGNCQPNQVDVSVQLTNTNPVKHVELYVRLLDKNSSDSTAWDSYAVMSDAGNGLYRVALKSSKIQGADQYTSAVVLYQFIVIGTNGKVIGRSPGYNDLSLAACRGIIVPPGGPTLIPPDDPTDVPTLIPPPK